MVHRQHAITDGQDKQRISENKKKIRETKVIRTHRQKDRERVTEGEGDRERHGDRERQSI